MRTGEMPPTVCLEARHLLLQLPASTWTLDGTSSWRIPVRALTSSHRTRSTMAATWPATLREDIRERLRQRYCSPSHVRRTVSSRLPLLPPPSPPASPAPPLPHPGRSDGCTNTSDRCEKRPYEDLIRSRTRLLQECQVPTRAAAVLPERAQHRARRPFLSSLLRGPGTKWSP